MDHMKNKLKRFAAETEMGAVRSILKWKFKKEGKRIPSAAELDEQSRKAALLANDLIMTTGKTVWNDLIEVYVKKGVKKEGAKKGGLGE